MNKMKILLVVAAYAAESLISALRLGAWESRSFTFLLWDTLLVGLPFSALWAWGTDNRLHVLLAAVAGSIIGAGVGLGVG